MNDIKFQKLLGKRIAQVRKSRGKTQQQMAKALKTWHSQIGRIERGEINTTILMLRKLAKYLGVQTSDLLKIEK